MRDREWVEKLLSGIERLKQGNEMVKALEPEVVEPVGETMEVTIAVQPAGWMKNEFGKISGAASAAIMEVSTGIAAQAIMDDNVTLDMNVSYLRELSAEGTIRTRVTVVKPGRQILRLRGEMYDGVTGKVAVLAALSIMKV
ncbi:MAG: PaaI family thioesterase [Firmicutes bacterium]|nr:PaaI family thioesterase [Bacillota bacterium]